ncbi:NEDD8-activating enzyme E1 catalytic subunit [Hypsibius exemplaris]|uniref:NEDD8-activating enzyme E1 catalytic subunit n=1 Tax=Hypsibius exemplaris TaxID=2072580 RepID=A0A1W0WMC5_HYPEX|nr:NEDD8-activating enzyme E1 catalytic subunit [Hypsibius exemplaris]
MALEDGANGDEADAIQGMDYGDDNVSADEVDDGAPQQDPRYKSISNLILRPGAMTRQDFEPCPELLDFIQNTCKVLIVGAGGLGCELLKNLALLGFRDLHVIDMDTIDLSNLNRQFLFRHNDIGKSKAECAANFINTRIPSCTVTPYCKRIEDFDEDFYRGFSVIVCGLDSIVARRWMNGMLLSMVAYDDEGNPDPTTVKPLIDGGTEGFKGNVRSVVPGITACLECSIDLYPPAVNFPMCTIAHTPRLPEHCIEYVKVLLWPKEEPFGAGIGVDGDDPKHISWICGKAEDRAKEFGIEGVTYRLTLGVIKNIIPAVASTNAVIAAACATEVFKVASSMYAPLDNYFLFNDVDGVYSSSFSYERNPECLACSQKPQLITAKPLDTLQDLIDALKEHPLFQMRSPGITTKINGKSKTLYMPNVPMLEAQTRENLERSLADLGFLDGQELVVVDVTSPTARVLTVKFP